MYLIAQHGGVWLPILRRKYRMCMKRAQEGLTGSSFDFTDPFRFNNSQAISQESQWNPFRIRSRNTTTSLFSLNCHESRLRTFPNMPLLNKIQIKPDRSFRICGDEKKNILLSIEDSWVCSNTRLPVLDWLVMENPSSLGKMVILVMEVRLEV